MNGNMKSESWIIVELGIALLLLTVLSFFVTPAYEKAVWYGMGVFASGFTMVMGYKFGRSMPQQSTDAKPGQTSQSETSVQTTPEPPPPSPKVASVTAVEPAPPAPKPPVLPQW